MKSLEEKFIEVDEINKLFEEFFKKLEEILQGKNQTMIFEIKKNFGKNTFFILVSCLLSLRARDSIVLEICKNIFQELKKPDDFLKIETEELEEKIRKIGFFKKKAENLKFVSREINEKFFGNVPNSFKELISIRGVGQKTANLTLSEAFEMDYVCVDTHVYRISRDLGISDEKNFLKVEIDIMNFFPKKYWKNLNSFFVRYGQNVYKPNLKNRKNEDFFYLKDLVERIKKLKKGQFA